MTRSTAAARGAKATEAGPWLPGRPGASSVAPARRWELFFAARMGPLRPRTITVCGVKVKTRGQRLELPPNKNDTSLHRYRRGQWVAEWRETAAMAARLEYRIPHLERIRISGVVYRARLGVADAMNDLDRLHPLVDGLQDAGVIDRDTRRHVEHGTVTEERIGPLGPGILLVIEEVLP